MLRKVLIGGALGLVVGPIAALAVSVVIIAYAVFRNMPGTGEAVVGLMFFVFGMLPMGSITGALTGAIPSRMGNRRSSLLVGAIAGITVAVVSGIGAVESGAIVPKNMGGFLVIYAMLSLPNAIAGVRVAWMLRTKDLRTKNKDAG